MLVVVGVIAVVGVGGAFIVVGASSGTGILTGHRRLISRRRGLHIVVVPRGVAVRCSIGWWRGIVGIGVVLRLRLGALSGEDGRAVFGPLVSELSRKSIFGLYEDCRGLITDQREGSLLYRVAEDIDILTCVATYHRAKRAGVHRLLLRLRHQYGRRYRFRYCNSTVGLSVSSVPCD